MFDHNRMFLNKWNRNFENLLSSISNDSCGVRTHADRSTRTWVWRLRPLGQTVLRRGGAQGITTAFVRCWWSVRIFGSHPSDPRSSLAVAEFARWLNTGYKLRHNIISKETRALRTPPRSVSRAQGSQSWVGEGVLYLYDAASSFSLNIVCSFFGFKLHHRVL